MVKEKGKLISLLVGAIFLIAGIVGMIMTYIPGDYKNYNYGYALLILFVGVAILGFALVNLKKTDTKKIDTLIVAQASLCAALSYIGCTFLKIQIPVPGTEGTMFHLGNVFCVLAALLIGGYWGGMAGAIGMTASDLLSGIYITTAPKTFVLKLCIGLITGFVAHKLFKINQTNDKKKLFIGTVVSAIAGMGFNVIADPLVGYFYKTYLFGIPQDIAKTLAKINSITTLVNAVIAVIVSTIIYMALIPVMKKAGIAREGK